ncbi:MAG: ABC transporter permease [Anaerovoracaceae bacterium]
MKKFKFSYVYLGVILFIIYIPIILTIIYSFNESRISSIWGGFSLDWYLELFSDDEIWEALKNSIILATVSSFIGMSIGLMGALAISKDRNKVDGSIEYISLLPIMIPEIILGMVFLALFSLVSLPLGMLTLVLAHVTFCVPYNYMLIKARLAEQNGHIEDAARDLGASPRDVFRDITLPFLKPAILSGMILSFAMSFDDVIISVFVTGPTVNTLPIKIYTMIKTGVTPEINALSTLMVGVIIIAMILLKAISINKRKKEGYYEKIN